LDESAMGELYCGRRSGSLALATRQAIKTFGIYHRPSQWARMSSRARAALEAK
jgi:hypothetical protein